MYYEITPIYIDPYVVLILVIIGCVQFGIACSVVAAAKNLPKFQWFAFGFLFGLFSFLYVCFTPRNPSHEEALQYGAVLKLRTADDLGRLPSTKAAPRLYAGLEARLKKQSLT